MTKKFGVLTEDSPSCQGTFRVEILRDRRPLPWSDGTTIKVKLLEPMTLTISPRHSPKSFTHPAGTILYVSPNMVKETDTERVR